jgi:SAM-dependent methyltransferase
MNPFPKIIRILRQLGPKGIAIKCYIVLVDWWFDFRYRVDTRQIVPLDYLTISGENKQHGHRYEPARTAILRKVLPRLKELAPDSSTFVDLGSGKGRVLMVAAEYGFRKAKGIEFAGDLCAIATSNCASFKERSGTNGEFDIIETDAAAYFPSKTDNVFFMFNPFDAVLLARVLANIEASVATSPRPIFICYYNPAFGESAEDQSGFRKLMDLDFWGYRFKVYSNTPEVTED